MLKIYNSLTDKIEEFKPKKEGVVNMYVCGPTVYNYIHIGNARPVIFYDMVKNYLEFIGYKVNYASNITDVDDKIIKRAIEENKTEKEITNFYENAYFDAVKMVGSNKPDFIPHATEYINEMISFIKELIDKGYAYSVDGDVYFSVDKIEDYGILSNQVKTELDFGNRINVSDKKRSPNDFNLWKKTEEGIKWDSPFGAGRPGWHTECVVMNHKLFGDGLDIHGGGMDLKFPHHENEIAQFEALYKSHLANYWIHVGRLDLSGTKMSKSLGNVIYVKDLKNKKEGMILRSLILFSPYRSIIDYKEELVKFYSDEYDKWQRVYKQVLYELQYRDLLVDDFKSNVDEEYINEFKNEMDNDFNVQNVLTLISKLTKDLNVSLRSKDYNKLQSLFNTFRCIFNVLGIDLFINSLSGDELDLYKKWNDARINKDFNLADEYRKKLQEKGIL